MADHATPGTRFVKEAYSVQRAWLPQHPDRQLPIEADFDACYVLSTRSWELARAPAVLPSPRGGHAALVAPLRRAGRWDLGVLVLGGRHFDEETGAHRGRDDAVFFSLSGPAAEPAGG